MSATTNRQQIVPKKDYVKALYVGNAIPIYSAFCHIGKFVLYDKKPREDAHANADVVCRLCDAFAAQNFAMQNSFIKND